MASIAIEAEIQRVVDEKFQELLKDQDERFKTLNGAYEDLSSKVVEAVALKEEFARLSTTTEEMLQNLKTELQSEFNSVSEGLKEALGRCQDDPEGESGLKQLRAQVQTFAEDMKGFRDQVEKYGDVVKSCKSSTDEMNLQVKDLARRCEATSGTVGPVEERLKKAEQLCDEVRGRQEVVEDSVAGKYNELWKDVLHELEKMKSSLEQSVEERQASKSESDALCKHMRDLLSKDQQERRKMAATKSLLSAWQQHTWQALRRNTGTQWLLNSLAGVAKRRQQQSLHRWVRRTSIACLAKELSEEYSKKIPDVPKAIEDSKVIERCVKLEAEMQISRQEEEKLSEVLASHREKMASTEKELGLRREEITVAEQKLGQVFDREELLDMRTKKVESELEGNNNRCSALEEAQRGNATLQEVKEVQDDITRFWLCVKSLDSGKASKQDMDAIVLEMSKVTRQLERQIQDSQRELNEKREEDTLRMQEKCADLENRVDDKERQLTMKWEKLTDTVVELAEQQQQPEVVTQPALRSRGRPASATVLPGFGRYGSRTLLGKESEGADPLIQTSSMKVERLDLQRP